MSEAPNTTTAANAETEDILAASMKDAIEKFPAFAEPLAAVFASMGIMGRQLGEELTSVQNRLVVVEAEVQQMREAASDAAVAASGLYESSTALHDLLLDVMVKAGWASEAKDGEVVPTEDCPDEILKRFEAATELHSEATAAWEAISGGDDEDAGDRE